MGSDDLKIMWAVKRSSEAVEFIKDVHDVLTDVMTGINGIRTNEVLMRNCVNCKHNKVCAVLRDRSVSTLEIIYAPCENWEMSGGKPL